jgi:hypothetical protein
MAEIESKILGEELGKLGGFGARFVARFLPDVAYEATCEVAASEEELRLAVAEIFNELGAEVPQLPGLAVVFGSGEMNLNPAIVTATVSPSPSGASVLLRGVAKEGLIKQDTARKAVERVALMISERFRGQFS